MKFLMFAASLRKESMNRKLIGLAAGIVRGAGHVVDLADFHEFDMPLYNGDLQAQSGLPPGALEMVRRIEGADGLIIASPEYNYSLPGTLKNAIDWVSRAKPMPLRGKSGLLLSAATSVVGGIRGLWQLRIPLEGLGVFLYPDMFALAAADKAFAEDGTLKDPTLSSWLQTIMASYLKAAEALAKR